MKQALVKREGEEWPLFLGLKRVMTFKVDPRMRAAIEKYIKEHGIDWREEKGQR